MTVYVVTKGYEYERYTVAGVFLSMSKAQDHVSSEIEENSDEYICQTSDQGKSWRVRANQFGMNYEIDTHEVQE